MTVDDALPDGWALTWQSRQTALGDLTAGLPSADAEALEALLAEVPPQRIEYDVDGFGALRSITRLRVTDVTPLE